jgi:exopolysaccharide biosynthesis protein
MKKFFVTTLVLLGLSGVMFAQTAPAKKDAVKKTEKAAKTTKATTTDAKPATTSTPVKKDGTPDMRFKENKNKPKPAGPLKKDGTPDKRFKANKKS